MLLLLLQIPCISRAMCWGQTTQVSCHKEQAREEGLSIWEAECCLDAELFLEEYPRLDLWGQYHPLILQRMFVHAAKEGQKEAERFICWGHWCSLPRPSPEADVPTVQIVGY